MSTEAMQARAPAPRHPAFAEAQGVPPGYTRTEAGAIPVGWDYRPLRDDVLLLSGHHVLAEYCNTQGNGTPYLTGPADFPNGRIEHTKYTLRPTTLCAAGDILVTVKGSGSGTLVRADAEYCISRQLMAIRASSWDQGFLYYSLAQNASQVKAASTGLIPGLSRADILDQHLPIPGNLAEQRAIAEALLDVDRLLEALAALIAKNRAIKLAAMQQLLTGETRLQGFSGEWGTKQLGELGHFLKGRGVSRADAHSGPLACVRYGELYTAHDDCIRAFRSWISPEVAATATRLEYGDLLFAGSGETKTEIGKSAAFVTHTEAYAGGDIVILRPNNVDPVFLGYASNVPAVVRQKASFGQGDAVVHISAAALAKVSLPFPPIEEQSAIAAVLSDMDAEITALEARRDKTRAIKQGMMQQLLTGRVRLVDPSPAEATP